MKNEAELFDKSLAMAGEHEDRLSKRDEANIIVSKDEHIQVVGFMLKGELFGVDILNVEEIIKPVDFTYVPNTKSFVMGVVNLRGKIIPIVDLRLKFGLVQKPIGSETRIIVAYMEDNTVGFIVDKIERVYYIEKKSIEPTPPNIPQTIEKYVKGVGKMDNKIMTLLNIENLLKEGGGLN